MKLTANKIAGIIRKNGYKLTPQRHAVLKVIAASRDHLTPEAIYEKARQEKSDIGLVTVYRTLELLSRLDLLCQVHSPDGCRNYMMRRPVEHHHHLICSSCGRVVDFSGCSLTDLEEKLSSETKFDIHSHLLEFYGICSECRPASA
jgi:Fur family ferric uptake transcriptional regulator